MLPKNTAIKNIARFLKFCYTLIIGDKERDSKTISYRLRKSNETFNLSQDDFVNLLKQEINNMKGEIE